MATSKRELARSPTKENGARLERELEEGGGGGLFATEHLFDKTKGGLNILTNVGRKTIEFRKQERAKGTEKVCNIATGSNGYLGK